MYFKEETLKYFCRISWRSGQSRNKCFIVKETSQDVREYMLVGLFRTVGKSVSNENDQFSIC